MNRVNDFPEQFNNVMKVIGAGLRMPFDDLVVATRNPNKFTLTEHEAFINTLTTAGLLVDTEGYIRLSYNRLPKSNLDYRVHWFGGRDDKTISDNFLKFVQEKRDGVLTVIYKKIEDVDSVLFIDSLTANAATPHPVFLPMVEFCNGEPKIVSRFYLDIGTIPPQRSRFAMLFEQSTKRDAILNHAINLGADTNAAMRGVTYSDDMKKNVQDFPFFMRSVESFVKGAKFNFV